MTDGAFLCDFCFCADGFHDLIYSHIQNMPVMAASKALGVSYASLRLGRHDTGPPSRFFRATNYKEERMTLPRFPGLNQIKCWISPWGSFPTLGYIVGGCCRVSCQPISCTEAPRRNCTTLGSETCPGEVATACPAANCQLPVGPKVAYRSAP